MSEEIILDKKIEKTDIIDHMTLGEMITIITYSKNKEYFPEITKAIKPYLHLVLQFRNQISAHPPSEDLEQILSSKVKYRFNDFSNIVLDYFGKIESR